MISTWSLIAFLRRGMLLFGGGGVGVYVSGVSVRE